MKQFSIRLAFEDRFHIPALNGFVSNLAHDQVSGYVVLNPLKYRLSIFNQNIDSVDSHQPATSFVSSKVLETPAALYQSSPRAYPAKLPPLEYPTHFETRYVSHKGGIRWTCAWVNVSITWAGEYVGLEEIDNGIWNVYFGPPKLRRLSEEKMRVEDAYGSLWRHNKKQKL